ncbi:MAG: nucleotide exchange factor GrpE [Oscillospiraceae bacterium]|nr:nucleotide exchange factor GrpE [Oscillospiraceae bacterium]
MSKKNKQENPEVQENTAQQEQAEETVEPAAETREDETAQLKEQLAQKEDQYLRLAAEYDNYRKRTAKEKESIWTEVKADTAAAFLPVYDNLERAVKQETGDEAYKKGVEMTMNQLKEVFTRLGIEEIPALGEKFDPNVHNAVMHIDDEQFGENEIAEVFQAGFRCGEKVIRFAMVKVAN